MRNIPAPIETIAATASCTWRSGYMRPRTQLRSWANRAGCALIVAMIAFTSASGASAANVAAGVPFAIANDYLVGDRFMGVRLRGALKLRPPLVNGITAHGLSGLTWDADDEILYAVSDLGYLTHLRPQFTDGFLTGVEILASLESAGLSRSYASTTPIPVPLFAPRTIAV